MNHERQSHRVWRAKLVQFLLVVAARLIDRLANPRVPRTAFVASRASPASAVRDAQRRDRRHRPARYDRAVAGAGARPHQRSHARRRPIMNATSRSTR